MADVTLSDGRQVEINLNRITLREYRALFDKDQPEAEGDATLAKAAGLGAAELLDLSPIDYRQLTAVFFRKAREPLADPNSVSASSSG